MTYPTQEQVLEASPMLLWIDEHFLRHDPYAFRGVDFRSVLSLVSEELEVDANGIFCIGSGAVGLSLNPDKITGGQLKQFDLGSDLDLAVVSEVHFETAWRDLRRAAQPTLHEMDVIVAENLKWQKKRFFDGAILAHKLLPVLSYGKDWITSLVKVGERIAVLLDREVDVNAMIFRDYWSLRNYVAGSIVRCKRGAT